MFVKWYVDLIGSDSLQEAFLSINSKLQIVYIGPLHNKVLVSPGTKFRHAEETGFWHWLHLIPFKKLNKGCSYYRSHKQNKFQKL